MKFFNLDGPSDDIEQVLPKIAARIGSNVRATEANDLAATFFVARFQDGKLGKFQLDEVPKRPERLRSAPASRTVFDLPTVSMAAADNPLTA